MANTDKPETPDDAGKSLEDMMKKLLQVNPAELNPENVQEVLGGAKMVDVFQKLQQQARKMAQQLADQEGIDLDQLDDDDDDGWFDEADEDFDEEALEEALFARPTKHDGHWQDFPGAESLWQVALELPAEQRLVVSIEINSPPVTQVEQMYYHVCHYRLLFDPCDSKVTFRDVNTPRQDYLQGKGWPAMLAQPRKSWPELTPLWDTLKVEQYNLREALQSNDYAKVSRDDLQESARQALSAGFGNGT